MDSSWYAKSPQELFESFSSDELGLSSLEVKKRIEEYGPNALPEPKVPSVFSLFLSQFLSPLIYVLIVAALIVFFMGETADAIIIFLVLFFNAIVGTIQEGRAERTLSALRKFVETSATVLRGGEIIILPDREVVPGDILILQEGDKVSADARLLSEQSIKLDESSLTGESIPVSKTADTLSEENLPVHHQKNMVFKGTNVVSGNGKAIVVSTGLRTEIGKISQAVASIDT
ncbi:MAG: HAD-IC family P-type ATPase, partial [Patescibacteria group bacterium]